MTAPVDRSAETADSVFVASRLFGPLHLPQDQILTMPEGMLGFAGERRFVLLPASPEGVFWFQNVDDGALIFLLVDPFLFFPGYVVDAPDVPESRTPDMAALAIVTLPRGPREECTANLQGPLVIDFVTRQARQVIQDDPRYHTRHPIDLRSRVA
ncbi:MAG TPA: flagellar assembly protein FliW [Gemmatimonadales bacterium]|nr:flagellar assembly protein FliW [Gemmatimonadales bacterium]